MANSADENIRTIADADLSPQQADADGLVGGVVNTKSDPNAKAAAAARKADAEARRKNMKQG